MPSGTHATGGRRSKIMGTMPIQQQYRRLDAADEGPELVEDHELAELAEREDALLPAEDLLLLEPTPMAQASVLHVS